jgi:hypothetical protein
MTDAKELERVRRIHAALDYAAAHGCPEGGTYDQLSDVLSFGGHKYTAAEIRAWPEMKAKMLKQLEDSAAAYARMDPLSGNYSASSGSTLDFLDRYGAAEKARGLVMYREMLSDSPAPSETSILNPVYQNAVLLRRPPEQKRVDPYNPYNMQREQMLREEQNIALTMTNESSIGKANQAARLRNIAALRAELDTSSEERWRRCTGPWHPMTGRPLR